MRKEELRASLGRIRPEESLIQQTLLRVQEQKERQARRFNPFAYTYRLAGAMCALLLLVGFGLGVAGDRISSPVADTPDSYTRTQFNDVAEPIASSQEHALPEDEQGTLPADTAESAHIEAAVQALREIAQQLDCEWVLLQGQVNGCYFLPGQDEVSVCAVALGVDQIHDASSESILVEDMVSAEIRFADGAQMQTFVDAMGAKLCLVLIPNEGSGESALQIEEYIIIE